MECADCLFAVNEKTLRTLVFLFLLVVAAVIVGVVAFKNAA